MSEHTDIAQGPAHVLMLGNPNAGKTTLFNRLTGLNARVGNYPGITVDFREAHVRTDGRALNLIDAPGTYSLAARSDDEVVTTQLAFGLVGAIGVPDVLLLIADATRLSRSLYLVEQARALGLPAVVALTFADVARADGTTIDVATLKARLGLPVLEVGPHDPAGDAALLAALGETAAGPAASVATDPNSGPVPSEGLLRMLDAYDKRGAVFAGTPHANRALPDGDPTADAVALGQTVQDVLKGVVKAGPDPEDTSKARSERLDRIALHPVLGPLVAVGLFGLLFQVLFAWSDPFIGAIEGAVGWLSGALGGVLPQDSLVSSLILDGIVAGVGNVLVFVPQITFLFVFIALLEDSGYLARAAFLLDRVMARVGLHGRAFVPMLSGFACAVPAIMATRTIESKKDRIVTILVTPLVSCSARLPVYGLMIAAVFSTMPPVFGVVATGTVVLISMYLLSIVAALGMAALFKRTLLKSPTPALVLELPDYRVPRAGSVARVVGGKVRAFIVDAGTVILAATVVLWGLFTFPRMDTPEPPAPTPTMTEVQAAAATQAIAAHKQAALAQSYAGTLGRAMEPVIAPLGFDWKIGVGLVASFAAREVLVSSLGIVYGLGEVEDENDKGLRAAVRADKHPDGRPVYTPLTALSLMVFFVLAMQCMSTLAATKRETGGLFWPAVQLGYMTLLAYTASLLVFQVGRAFGFS